MDGKVDGGGGEHHHHLTDEVVSAVMEERTLLLVENLYWWTTDDDLESEAAKYGKVKEVKFFEVTESGKSSGQCHVEFYQPAAAAACKARMNGHPFNGKPCEVGFASPDSVKRMEAQVIRNQAHIACSVRRGRDREPKTRGPTNAGPVTSYQGYGRGNWGRSLVRNGGSGFGPGSGAAPLPMYPNSMMGDGFGPAFGGPMGRMGTYGGYHGAPAPPFCGPMGFPGVPPPPNPGFFGMGMMPGNVSGPNMGMWSDPSMRGWGGGRAGESSYGVEAAAYDHWYVEVSHHRGGSSDRRYLEDRPREMDVGRQDHDRSEGERRDDGRERERVHERDRERSRGRDWNRDRDRYMDDRDRSANHQEDRDDGRERKGVHERHRERSRDRETERDRDRDKDCDRYRGDRDRSADHHRYRDDEVHGKDWDRGRSSKSRSKSRSSQH